jgi:hypothetical protein
VIRIRRVVLAAVLAVLAVPVVAFAEATRTTETFTEATNFFQGTDTCAEIPTTGTGTQTVTVTEVETPTGGLHFQFDVVGSVDLYEALGPGPWDPQAGAYVGTWTYHGTVTDEGNFKFSGAVDGTTHGVFTFADGRTAMRMSEFHVSWHEDAPTLFFAHFACGGN